MEKIPTQEELILNYMKEHGSITSMDAFLYLNITRLSARIYDLRAQGYIIDTEIKSTKPVMGRAKKYAEYILREEVKSE